MANKPKPEPARKPRPHKSGEKSSDVQVFLLPLVELGAQLGTAFLLNFLNSKLVKKKD